MTTSKPSREIHVIDVPEVSNFTARFVYNYHVPSEGSNPLSGFSDAVLEKTGEELNSKLIDVIGGKLPRYVKFTWSPVTYRDRIYGQSPYIQDSKLPKNYISENVTKILSEEHFASEQYTSLNITDQSIDKKIFHLVSSSATLLNGERQLALTQHGLALKTNEITNDQVDFQFLSKYLVQPSEDGAFFYENSSQRIRNDVVNKLKDFNIQVQFNNSVVHSLVKRAVAFPESTFSSVYLPMYEVSKKLQGQAMARGLRELKADDYRTYAPEYVDLQVVKNTQSSLATRARIVGYIIDRHEMLPNGQSRLLEPIIVENQSSNCTLDIKIKYYAKYHYTIRTVAEFTVPSIVEDTGELAVVKFLISSKPSTPKIVSCEEVVPPPPPSDTKFVWDYENGKLFVSWAFPTNTQRDIKQFQVFRRKSVNEPYQLVRQYHFDDSTVQAPYHEMPDPRLVEISSSPKLGWVDSEFTKDSSYIYAIGSIDAHGLVSSYSAQTLVTFNRYKNKLVCERISPEGAPKPYPNVYLKADVFKDSIIESRKYKMNIAFVPEHVRIFDAQNNDVGFLKTEEQSCSYKILVTNTDLATASTVDVRLKDKRTTKDINQTAAYLNVPDYGDKIVKGNFK